MYLFHHLRGSCFRRGLSNKSNGEFSGPGWFPVFFGSGVTRVTPVTPCQPLKLMTDQWEWYIYILPTNLPLKKQQNVEKYTQSPLIHIGFTIEKKCMVYLLAFTIKMHYVFMRTLILWDVCLLIYH